MNTAREELITTLAPVMRALEGTALQGEGEAMIVKAISIDKIGTVKIEAVWRARQEHIFGESEPGVYFIGGSLSEQFENMLTERLLRALDARGWNTFAARTFKREGFSRVATILANSPIYREWELDIVGM